MTSDAQPLMVPRPRVEERVRTGLERGAVVLVAPAGWGKSAAVGAALADRVGPVAWHVCTERDRDAGRLLVGVLRAIRSAVPGAADVLLEQLETPGETVEPIRVADALLEELSGLLVEPLVLVLDDAERLADEDATTEILEMLIDANADVLRLALASRRRPPLRLARRQAAGRVVVVGTDDLRFDHDDCAALLAARDGADPDDQRIVRALDETDGWPLGLALGGDGPVARRAGLEEYVTEEVLDGLRPELRAALLDTSVEDVLSPGEGTLGDAPVGLLEAAAARGLVPQPATGKTDGAVRWHPLVREALHARWRAERPPEARSRILAAVAERLLAADRPAEAVDRWLEAGRPEAALQAMSAPAPESLRVAPGTVAGWIAALPADVRSTPLAEWLAARLASTEGRMRVAAEHDVRALDGLDDDRRDVSLMGVMESTYFIGDLSIADPVREILEDPESLAGRPLALLACAWLGICRAAHGDVPDGVALAERAFAQPGGAFAREFELLLRTFERLPAGGHVDLRAQLQAAEARPAVAFPEWMASIRGFLEVDAGRRDEAVAQARRMIDSADHAHGTRFWRTLGVVQHGWALAVAGRTTEAALVLAPLRGARFEGWPHCWVDAGLAIVADAAADHDAARDHAEQALVQGARAPIFLRVILVLNVVPVLVRAGAGDRAIALLDETLAIVERRLGRTGGAYAAARLRASRAGLRDAAGDRDGAGEDLRAALAGGPDVVRAEWASIGALVHAALGRDELDAGTVVPLVDRAFGGGPEVLALAGHATPAVRAEAVAAVAASGHPSAAGVLKVLRADADAAVATRAGDAQMRASVSVPSLDIRLLGGFEVRRGPWLVDERAWGRPTAARLVRFLLVHRGTLVPQDRILEALWPDRPPEAAKGQLQVAVSRARAVVDPPGTTAADSAIAFRDGGYRIVLGPADRVDTQAFAAAAAAALRSTSAERGPALQAAAALWTAEPLPEERYAGWADAWADELRATLHEVLRALAADARASGDEPGVAAAARRLLELDPVDEDAHRMLMVAYARTGRPALALRQFLACRRALVETLGIEPSRETAAIQADVLAGRLGPSTSG
jgi:DNA-binding SARP family transcriptional activator/tetratricopeptide (TPR) repeat protein